MTRWRLHWRANSLYGRRDFAAAATIFEEITRADPGNGFAAFMLASCYEHQERYSEALHWAEVAADRLPGSLPVLQTAARLAIADGDHEKATDYVVRALALPEVTTEMPRETLLPRPLLWLIWALYRTPFLRRWLRPGALDELQPGTQALELQKWKEWAQSYLAWRNGNYDATPPKRPH
jgi:tetratricopeptide (TPR) repeat protein